MNNPTQSTSSPPAPPLPIASIPIIGPSLSEANIVSRIQSIIEKPERFLISFKKSSSSRVYKLYPQSEIIDDKTNFYPDLSHSSYIQAEYQGPGYKIKIIDNSNAIGPQEIHFADVSLPDVNKSMIFPLEYNVSFQSPGNTSLLGSIKMNEPYDNKSFISIADGGNKVLYTSEVARLKPIHKGCCVVCIETTEMVLLIWTCGVCFILTSFLQCCESTDDHVEKTALCRMNNTVKKGSLSFSRVISFN